MFVFGAAMKIDPEFDPLGMLRELVHEERAASANGGAREDGFGEPVIERILANSMLITSELDDGNDGDGSRGRSLGVMFY